MLYNFSIWCFGILVWLAAPFNRKASLWVRGRRRIFGRLKEAFTGTDRPERVVWIHAASLGEFEQGRPVIEAIRERHPEYKILLTFFSPSGYEVRKEYSGADYIFYLPADTRRNARRFMRIVRPEAAIFIKYEFWLNYLRELRRSECRSYLISAIFRRNSAFFKWYGGMYRKALTTYQTIFVQQGESCKLLESIGVTNVVEAGDTRFDRVAAIARSAKKNEIVERFKGDSRLLVAGSTWPQDEQILAQVAGVFENIKLVVVPHEIGAARVDKLVASMPVPTIKYTAVDDKTDLEAAQVLVVDTIGMLSSLYSYASLAYIGGGFGVGIHNTLEAATFGLPISFGPNYQKFKEARDMIKIGCAVSIPSAAMLQNWIGSLDRDEELYRATCEKAAGYVASNEGATELILKAIWP